MVKNYNLNVTEVRDSDFKKCFSRNFRFHRRDPTVEDSYSFGPGPVKTNLAVFMLAIAESVFKLIFRCYGFK